MSGLFWASSLGLEAFFGGSSRLKGHGMNKPVLRRDGKPYLPTYSQTELFFIYLMMPVLVFMVIYFAPVDVLDQWSWARVMSDEVWRIFPALKREAVHSTFPQVRQFGVCLVMASMPVQMLVYLIAFAWRAKSLFINMEANKRMGWSKAFLIALIFLCIACFYLVNEPQAPLGRVSLLVETRRFSAAFTDAGLLLSIPASFLLILFSMVGMTVDLFRRGR